MDEKHILRIELIDNWGDEKDKNVFEFEVDRPINLWHFHRLMKSAAKGFGYSDKLVEEVFGESIYED